MEYHIAHSVAIVEYLLTLYCNPTLKINSYVSQVGEYTRCVRRCRPLNVVQVLR